MALSFEQAIVDSLPTFENAGGSASLDPTVDAHARVRGTSASLKPQTASIAGEDDKEFAG